MSDLEPRQDAWLHSAIEHACTLFRHRAGLTEPAARWLLAHALPVETYPAGAVVRAPEGRRRRKWLISGWAAETRVLPDCRRQICSLLLPGDVFHARPAAPGQPCSVVALTRLDCLDLQQLLNRAPDLERSWIEAAADQSLSDADERKYDYIVRLGQQAAAARIASLMLELRERLEVEESFQLPLTQEDIGDILGLSVVHVNRTLRQLRERELLEVRFGWVKLLNAGKLAAVMGGPTIAAGSGPAEARDKPLD